jgi:hypothetical protein
MTLAGVCLAMMGHTDPAAANHQHKRCFPKGSQTVAASDRARVYEWSQPDDRDVVQVCVFRTGRRIELGYSSTAARDSFYLQRVRFAKWQLAYVWRGCLVYCNNGVARVNLRTGQRRGFASGEYISVPDLELKSNGSLAWIQQEFDSSAGQPLRNIRVLKHDAGGTTELDAGMGIASESLALSDSWLYWTRAGEPRFAMLD